MDIGPNFNIFIAKALDNHRTSTYNAEASINRNIPWDILFLAHRKPVFLCYTPAVLSLSRPQIVTITP